MMCFILIYSGTVTRVTVNFRGFKRGKDFEKLMVYTVTVYSSIINFTKEFCFGYSMKL